MALLDFWARINANVILKKLKEIENEEIKLHNGDELGILPPVTGG